MKWRSRNNKRLDRQTVVEAFEEILFRGPRDDEVRQVVDNGLDRAALVDGLRACAEHRKVVGLLRALLRRDSRSWLRREPTRAELAAAIGRLRGHYKNDEDLRRAMAHGDPIHIKSRLQRHTLVEAFEETLFREPHDHEVRRAMDSGLGHVGLVDELRACTEHREIVGLLRALLRRDGRSWLLREPTRGELAAAIGRFRSKFDSDQELRRAIIEGLPIHLRPLAMEMDITNQCNLRCVMCAFSHPSMNSQPRRHLSVEEFEDLADQLFARVHRVSLSFGTEPLLHNDIEQFFAILARHEVPYAFMNTNGLLLREPLIESMIEHGFNTLFVSVDAATRETYESIRIGGSFDRLMRKLELLRTVKQWHGVDHPTLTMGFVLMRNNLHELPAFVDLAAELGAGSVNAMHMASFELIGNHEMGANFAKEECNSVVAAARERAAARGIDLVAPSSFTIAGEFEVAPRMADLGGPIQSSRASDYGVIVEEKRNAPSCPFPGNFLAIDMNGNVLPCGWWHGADPMGNIHSQDFLSIWHGEPYQELRQRQLEHRLEGVCEACPAAGMSAPDAAGAFAPRQVSQ